MLSLLPNTQAQKPDRAELLSILDDARWAPSAGNDQPWCFHIAASSDLSLRIRPIRGPHMSTMPEDVFLHAGFLLETLSIAARHRGWEPQTDRPVDAADGQIILNITFTRMAQSGDKLYSMITTRQVDRGYYKKAKISDAIKQDLESSLGNALGIVWLDRLQERWIATSINMRASIIRYSNRDAFTRLHEILDWDNRKSPTGIPVAALGLDPLTKKLMRFLMPRWQLAQLINMTLGGILIPLLFLDLIPGLLCSGHFLIYSKIGSPRFEDSLLAGRSLQRFWLTAAQHGLVLHPSYAPLMFSQPTVRNSLSEALQRKSRSLEQRMVNFSGTPRRHMVFWGRIGYSRQGTDTPRSVRKPLSELVVDV